MGKPGPGFVISDIPNSIMKVSKQLSEVLGYPHLLGYYIHDPLIRNVIYIGNPNTTMQHVFIQTPYDVNRIAYLVIEGPLKTTYKINKPINYVVTPSKQWVEYLRAYSSNVVVIPHGIDTRHYVEPKSFEERDLFLYIAGYMHRKYPPYAFPIYEEFGKLIHIVTNSQNPYLQFFNVLTTKIYTREVTDEYIYGLYATHRFYLNLSDSEGYGLTPYEACNYGAVPILPRLPVFLEYFPSDLPIWFELTGETYCEDFVFECIQHYVYDVNSLREAIKYAINMKKEEWVDKSARCMEWVKAFDYRVVYQKFKELLI